MSVWGNILNWFKKPTVSWNAETGQLGFNENVSPLKVASVIAAAAVAAFSAKGISDKLTEGKKLEIATNIQPIFQSTIGGYNLPFQNLNLQPLADAISEESNFVGSKFGDIQLEFDKGTKALEAGDFDTGLSQIEFAKRKADEFLNIHLPSAEEDKDIPASLITDLRDTTNQVKAILGFNLSGVNTFRTNYEKFVTDTAKQEAERVAQLTLQSQTTAPATTPVTTVDPAMGAELERLRSQETQRLQTEQKRQEDVTIMTEGLLSAIEGLFTEGKKQGLAPIFSEEGPFRGELRGFAPIPKFDESLGKNSEILSAFSPQFGALQAMKAGAELRPFAEALTSPITPGVAGLGAQATEYTKLKGLFPDASVQQAAAEEAGKRIDWTPLMTGFGAVGTGLAGALLSGTRGTSALGYSGVPISSVYDMGGGQLSSISPERLASQQQARTLSTLMPNILAPRQPAQRLQQAPGRSIGLPQFAFPFLDDDFTFLATLARIGAI